MKNKKVGKYLLLTGLIVVLIAVGYVNYVIGNGGNKTNDNAVADSTGKIEGALKADDLAAMSSENYFEKYKANRETKRNTELALLDSIIKDGKSDAETVKDAQTQRMAIVQAMESELTIEGLLVGSGFKNAIVTVKEGSVNVVIDAKEISKEQAAKILEIVQEETKEPAQNIKVLLQ